MSDLKELIRWKALSRYLAGNDTSVSANRCPEKYQQKVDDLLEHVKSWSEKPEAGQN